MKVFGRERTILIFAKKSPYKKTISKENGHSKKRKRA